MIKELAMKNRSYRRFYHDKKVSTEELMDIIETTRYVACGGNKQLLRFMPVNNDEDNAELYKSLRWAGYLSDWDGPMADERPSAYIVVLSKGGASTNWDEGIAVQTMLLSAVEKGFGGCILANIDREAIRKDFEIEDDLDIKLVVALGVPKEDVRIVDIDQDDDIKYYRDEEGRHYVPKLKLEDLMY